MKPILIMIVLNFLLIFDHGRRDENYSMHESSKRKEHSSTLASYCVGRYLINLPKDFHDDGQSNQSIDGVAIKIIAENKSSFDNGMIIRRAALANQRRIYEPKDPSLKSITPITGGIVFDRAASDSSSVMRILELHSWRSGYHIAMEIEAIDASYITADNAVPGDTRKTTTPERMRKLLDVFEKTSLRKNNEIPKLSGICISNGFVSGEASNDETVMRIFISKKYDGVIFRFETCSDHFRGDKLVDRSRQADEIIHRNDGVIIRRGRHDILGVSEGEEFLYTIRDNENSKKPKKLSFNFSFEGNNKIGGAKTPLISLDFSGDLNQMPSRQMDSSSSSRNLNSGDETLFTKDVVVEIWDGVLPTIRQRPGAF